MSCVLLAVFKTNAVASNLGMGAAQGSVLLNWNGEETAWIESHKGKTLRMGLDPFVGMDYYLVDEKARGYMVDVVAILEHDLELQVEIEDDNNWEETLSRLKQGQLDIVFGANETEARKQYMSFTTPLYRYPYCIYTIKNSKIRTLGDLDGRKLGFLKGDAIEKEFPEIYKNVEYQVSEYADQIVALDAVRSGEVDAFITANGGITKKYAHDFSDIEIIADLTTFTSDMTLSTRKEDAVLAGILNKLIKHNSSEINASIIKATKAYNRYILELSPEEERWLKKHPKIAVGAPDDYLPFDYYKNGKYQGIAGDYLTEIANQVGLELEVVHGPFDEMYQKILKGEIHLLNMAKTEDRLEHFVYTNAFSEERDEIFGRRNLPYLQDIYELEGKKVAVVVGYWHKDYLLKNLSHVTFVETKDLKESLKFVSEGKADYLIENPTVANYYIDGLGYSTIIEKGTTSQDSYLYFGLPKEDAILASIINKAMSLVRYEKVKSAALQSVPSQKNVTTIKLVRMLVGVTLILTVVLFFVMRLFKELIDQKAQRKLLEEREKLIYKDGLTNLYNRMYFNIKEPEFEVMKIPQTFLMIDLNGLKQVNDNYGHAYGDLFICIFSDLLQKVFSNEIVIRMGGDEFLVVIPNADQNLLEDKLMQLDQACKDNPIKVSEEVSFIPSAAWGWAVCMPKGHTTEAELCQASVNSNPSHCKASVNECISLADQMMYQHKASLKRRRTDR